MPGPCCQRCGRVTPAPLPPGVPKGQYDPSVQAMTALLRGELRQSVRQTSAVMTKVMHVPVSPAMVATTSKESVRLAEQLLCQVRRMFRGWQKVRDGTWSRARFQQECRPVRRRLLALLQEGRAITCRKVRGMCKHILGLQDALFTFVDNEGVEPTTRRSEPCDSPSCGARAALAATEWAAVSSSSGFSPSERRCAARSATCMPISRMFARPLCTVSRLHTSCRCLSSMGLLWLWRRERLRYGYPCPAPATVRQIADRPGDDDDCHVGSAVAQRRKEANAYLLAPACALDAIDGKS